MKLSLKAKTALIALMLVVVGTGAATIEAHAYNCPGGGVQNSAAECGMHVAENGTSPLQEQVKDIINGALYVVGVLAVVMVIIGGVKYTTSGGDQAAVTSAKNTIVYSIVGLVIAILAYAIVNFVIGRLGNG